MKGKKKKPVSLFFQALMIDDLPGSRPLGGAERASISRPTLAARADRSLRSGQRATARTPPGNRGVLSNLTSRLNRSGVMNANARPAPFRRPPGSRSYKSRQPVEGPLRQPDLKPLVPKISAARLRPGAAFPSAAFIKSPPVKPLSEAQLRMHSICRCKHRTPPKISGDVFFNATAKRARYPAQSLPSDTPLRCFPRVIPFFFPFPVSFPFSRSPSRCPSETLRWPRFAADVEKLNGSSLAKKKKKKKEDP